jgi:hypothetical protein
VVSVFAIGPKVHGFKPDETRRRFFKGNINPLHTFLRRGLKARGPMSVRFYNM